MPFEIFIIPGLITFAYGFIRGLKYYTKVYNKEEDLN